MSLPKYQVHDETSQVSYNYLILVFLPMAMDMALSYTYVQWLVLVSFLRFSCLLFFHIRKANL